MTWKIGSSRPQSIGKNASTDSTPYSKRRNEKSRNGDDYMSKNKTRVIVEPGKQEFFIIREFDAPRELVFKAFTDPKLYVQWLGTRRMKMELEKFKPRAGG